MISRRTMLPMLSLAPLSRALGENISPPPTTRLLFGGDVMLSRYVGTVARDQHDPAFPLRDLAPVLAAADLAFVNLESPFSDRGRPIEAGMVFKAEPEMIDALEVAGIDIVSTANNHARDCDRYGVEFTLDWLAHHGIAADGSGSLSKGGWSRKFDPAGCFSMASTVLRTLVSAWASNVARSGPLRSIAARYNCSICRHRSGLTLLYYCAD